MKGFKGALSFVVVCFLGYGMGLGYNAYRREANQKERLEEQVRQSQERDPDSPVAMLIRDLVEGKPPKALSDEDKTAIQRLHNEAVSLVRSNRLPSALEKYREMTKLDPRNVEAHVGYAETALQQIRWVRGYEPSTYDQAYLDTLGDHMKAAGLLAPENFDVMLLAAHYQGYIGNLYLVAGDTAGAEDRFGRASRVLEDALTLFASDKAKIHQLILEQCGILRYRKAYKEALSKLDALMASQEMSLAVRGHLEFNKALVYAQMNDEKAAVEAFDRSLACYPEPPPAILLHRGKFLEERGYRNMALRDFEILGKMDPDNAFVRARITALKSNSPQEPGE
ncbi:MAG: tetratricopeptide repeat protein [Planctomycetota bacterium]